jgi:hypothetical protein
MSTTPGMATDDARLVTALTGIPEVDFPANLHAAMAAGRRMTSILADVVSLRRGRAGWHQPSFSYAEIGIRKIMSTSPLCGVEPGISCSAPALTAGCSA